MKKTIFAIAALALATLTGGSGWAQDKTAAEYKNDGNAAVKAKNYGEALIAFQKAIELWSPEELEIATVYNAADCAYKLKDYETSLKFYQQAEAASYKADFCAYYIAKNQEKLGREEEQVAKLEEAAKTHTVGKAAQFIKKDLCKVYTTKAKNIYDEGAELLKQAQTGTPEQQAKLKAQANEKFKEALPWVEKTLAVNPQDANGLAFQKAIGDALAE